MLKEVKIEKKNLSASINTNDFNSFATMDEHPSEVYTIAPISNTAPSSTTLSSLKKKHVYKEKAKPFSVYNFYKHGIAPGTEISGKVAPEGLKVNSGDVTGVMRLDLYEKSNLYKITQKQAIGNSKVTYSYHTMLPIHKGWSLGHDFGEDFETTYTHLVKKSNNFESKISLKEENKSIESKSII